MWILSVSASAPDRRHLRDFDTSQTSVKSQRASASHLTSFLDPPLDPRFEWLFVKETPDGILHQTKQRVIDTAWSSVHLLFYFTYEFIK